jgi:hypothetical protein
LRTRHSVLRNSDARGYIKQNLSFVLRNHGEWVRAPEIGQAPECLSVLDGDNLLKVQVAMLPQAEVRSAWRDRAAPRF